MNPDVYKNIFENFPYPRLLIKQEQGRILIENINQQGCEYFELKSKSVIGKTPEDLLSETIATHIVQSVKTCIKVKKPVTINIAPQLPGGVKVLAFTLNPIFGENGDVDLIDMIGNPDQAGAKNIQRERDDAIILLTSLFDATGVGIVVTDHFGRIVRINETFENEYGWASKDLLNQEFVILFPPDEIEISKKLHNAFIEKGKSGTKEIQIVRKDGQLRDVWLTSVLLELSQQRRFIVSTLKDITERKNMIRNLRHAKELSDASNKAKSAFLANMSHELRTPLNAIIGFTEMMRNETFGPIGNEKYTEYLSDIHFSSRHLLDIINDVLDMSKIEAGKVDLIESEVDLNDTFKTVQMIMSERAHRASINLEFNVNPDVQNLHADQRLLRQILINLIANAIKFSDGGTTVEVTAAPMSEKRYLRITVADQGCGIPKNKIAKVMEPFGQVHDPTRSRGQGTGLGLPLARAMVELHGGELLIESTRNVGTKIYLDFPLERTLKVKRENLQPQDL